MESKYINDREYSAKIKIRSDSESTINNLICIIQEVFDDISDNSDYIDIQLRTDIIHKKWMK